MPGLRVGDTLGPYQILSPLGEGGMGQVFRARDTRLGREVAIKTSAEKFSERFEREARVVASLNHPNICTLFDVGPDYIVMELIEGVTLAERIAEGPVPVEDALTISKQIAAALGEAHERGVIHRDLKPANVKLTPGGIAKVLDFGLAKVGPPENSALASGSGQENLTMTMNATQAGMILGTAAYMSPEQARGKAVDKRTDIWAFGVVMYEMLTGQHPFKGEGITDTLAAVLMKEPDLEAIPPRFRRVVQHCLQKEPHKRLRDISSVTLLLDEGPLTDSMLGSKAPSGINSGINSGVISGQMTLPPPLPETGRRRNRDSGKSSKWQWIGIMFMAATAMYFAFSSRRPRQTVITTPPVIARVNLDLAPASTLLGGSPGRPALPSFTISPDGQTVVFVGEVSGKTMLYKRRLADDQAAALPGTEAAEFPFPSPNGNWIGFAAGNKLKKISLNGGPPVEICDLDGPLAGASWGSAKEIAFRSPQGIMLVNEDGGDPELLLTADQDAKFISPATPLFLPDGETLLFTENLETSLEKSRIEALHMRSKRRETVVENASDPRYYRGYLLFVRDADLLAAPFDDDDAEVTGSPVPMIGGIVRAGNTPPEDSGMAQFAISTNGTLLYVQGPAKGSVSARERISALRLVMGWGEELRRRVTGSN